MRNIFFVILTIFLFSSFTKIQKDNIKAKLLNIEYYSKCDCSGKSPILVRVIYLIENKSLKDLKMKHTYSNGVTITTPIYEKDKKGNIVYSFCVSQNKTKEFSTIFVATNGEKSNKVEVKTDILNAEIIKGTAPKTVKF